MTEEKISSKEIFLPGTRKELLPLLRYCRQAGWQQTFPLTDEDALAHPYDLELSRDFESGLCLRLQIQCLSVAVYLLRNTDEGLVEMYDFHEFRKDFGNSFEFGVDQVFDIVPEIAFLTDKVMSKGKDEVLDGNLWRYISETLIAPAKSNAEMLRALYLANSLYDWDGFVTEGVFSEALADSTRTRAPKQLARFGIDPHIAAAAIETIMLMVRVYGCSSGQLKYIFRNLFQEGY